MTTAPIVLVCDEVVEIINDSELLGDGITATQEFNPSIDFKNACKRRCVVYPARNVSEEEISRKLTLHDYDCQILFQQKLCTPGTTAWDVMVRDLTGVVDSIAELFRKKRELPNEIAWAASVEIDPVMVPEHLDRLNMFTSVINLVLSQARN